MTMLQLSFFNDEILQIEKIWMSVGCPQKRQNILFFKLTFIIGPAITVCAKGCSWAFLFGDLGEWRAATCSFKGKKAMK